MPELPEVETIVRDLRPTLIGRTLTNPRLHHTNVLRQVSRARLLRTLARNTVVAVDRRAKHVVIGLDSGHRLVVQPRMTGSLIVHDRRLTREERRYAVLQVSLGGGSQLVYRDMRRLGTIWLLDEKGWRAYSARIGPEPLDPAFDAAAFAQRLSGSRQAIKKAIMDQRRLAGVGNIYANEALFRARIDPSRRADRLTPRDSQALFDAVRSVLGDAVAARGTTIRDYRTGTGQRGSFQGGLEVYGRGGEPCVRCGTGLVTTHTIDGRATTWCWRCQGGPRPARKT
ncbi:MAG: bifunctional DNA-formamidopyrimidine glycosylase/DNA-(apurinic or apyrimidinic site) lyase [Gemmatimonadota bacterium]|nr:bifunctional DNA-formamidopyrimidine glycosylase/DNA-(apurinic or apyrimidinic site) lyase [Gemmatimonadota bacterium]MDH3478098.1 bifunctional DNA-formamidopyrimidine glycosylase/DNA-(apurinic or apyrimidinic site) lyase [Gemmatimonadota bacterium]MDH3571424.1 bifunctional DNA-formamidopyrimidine glycosylase/DNA-(apurinic or apyrimidinic site) lyase [Gemmatimonadota bacterium]MDH5549420.1 bifunctional DNA-formamidopyrimidine glycosylase/DNA-(apurinic or apyrimidinic site) lyase [Gemmatimonad